MKLLVIWYCVIQTALWGQFGKTHWPKASLERWKAAPQQRSEIKAQSNKIFESDLCLLHFYQPYQSPVQGKHIWKLSAHSLFDLPGAIAMQSNCGDILLKEKSQPKLPVCWSTSHFNPIFKPFYCSLNSTELICRFVLHWNITVWVVQAISAKNYS